MDSRKIILIIPPQTEMSKEYLPSIGVAYLAAVAEKNNYEVKVIDSLICGYDVKQTINAAVKENPFLVGVSANTHNRFNAVDVINGIKNNNAGKIFTVAGGPHFTPTAKDALLNIPSLDFVVRNEGEITFIELINQLVKDRIINPENLKKINGLTFRNGQQIISNPDRDFIENLDDLPSPAWHLFDMDKYDARLEGMAKHRTVGIMSSRGCPHDCIFCVNSAFWKKIFRRHSPKRFIDEVEYLYKNYGFRAFDFWDDTMTIFRPHIEEICRLIIERNLEIKWYSRARVDTVDFELLSLMKKAGCESISFGVESGSERIIKKINKKITLEQVRGIAKICKELDLNTKFFFVYSLPSENEDDLKLTLNLMEELRSYSFKFHCYAGIARIYPGTNLEAIAKKEMKIPNDFNWYKKIFIELNKEIGADPTIPLYENESLSLGKIVDMVKKSEQEWIKKEGVLKLIKKGTRIIFRTRSIKGIKSLIRKFIDLKIKK